MEIKLAHNRIPELLQKLQILRLYLALVSTYPCAYSHRISAIRPAENFHEKVWTPVFPANVVNPCAQNRRTPVLSRAGKRLKR